MSGVHWIRPCEVVGDKNDDNFAKPSVIPTDTKSALKSLRVTGCR